MTFQQIEFIVKDSLIPYKNPLMLIGMIFYPDLNVLL